MAFIIILTLLCMFNFSLSQKDANTTRQTYIVQLDLPDTITTQSHEEFQTLYNSLLVSSGIMNSRLVHSYRHVMHGFAASLTPDEAKSIENLNEVVSVLPQQIIPLQTTHTPSFLGLNHNMGTWSASNFGKGMIIGVLDTGITPNHPSFNDDGISPPPLNWKGKCKLNGTACNNKLIGARNFLSDIRGQPLDFVGHGTHTAATAAGQFVSHASVFGQAYGTAVGMAPLAHLAIYRICGYFGCYVSDILAGMDAAIDDGVDVMSMSLGGPSEPFYLDAMGIAAYRAISRGIFVSCAAGNDGPSGISNVAPWILTVGASTIDRTIKSTVVLGNGEYLFGQTVFQPKTFLPVELPLINAGIKNPNSSFCDPGSLKKTNVKGKIVVCLGNGFPGIQKGKTVRDAGGAAMILVNDKFSAYSIMVEAHVLPAATVSYEAGQKILEYIKSTKNPTAAIVFKGTIIGDKTAPAVTWFSSRGPSLASPGIIKPDIIGPGSNILAAWNVPFYDINSRSDFKSNFNIISGTSMSTPHLSGIAALIMSVHPDWSPAAIKSAMMTTANVLNLGGTPILNEKLLPADIFSIGAGHINPSKAMDPGLIYDITPEDYLPYLCGLKYTKKQIKTITKHSVDCSTLGSISEAELNYPTMAVKLGGDRSSKKRYKRTVTNVGAADSTYVVELEFETGVSIRVVPAVLEFRERGQKLTYEVIFEKEKDLAGKVNCLFLEGSIVWKSVYSKHLVRNRVSIQLI